MRIPKKNHTIYSRSSSSERKSLQRKMNKIDMIERKFDKQKRKREDQFSEFVIQNGRDFLLSVNLLTRDNIPTEEALL